MPELFRLWNWDQTASHWQRLPGADRCGRGILYSTITGPEDPCVVAHAGLKPRR
jgi:hypothetical protein